MKKVIEFFRVLTQLKYLIPLMRYKWPDPESNASLAHMFEEAVDQYSSRPFMYFDDEIWTYERTNKAANTLAKYLVSRGVKHSDRVVLFMQNRPDYIVALLALNKICLLYTSDAADDMQCVDLGGRRIIKKKK